MIKNILKVFLLTIFTFAFFIHSNNVFAQIDIQSVTPEPTQPSQSAPSQTTQGSRPTVQRNTSNCVNHGRLTNKFSVDGIIYGQGKDGEWYAKGRNIKAEDVLSHIDEIVEETGITVDPNRGYAGASQNAEGVLRHELNIDRTNTGGAPVCDAVRLTGSSPSIFIYSANIKVRPQVSILYSENNSDYYYYEYDSSNVKFNKPKEGWIIYKKNLKTFGNNLADQMKLNNTERGRLYFELNFSASDVKSDKLFIGLIPQEQIDKNIPLKIESPNHPKVLRYHFYVTKAKSNNVKPPQLNPVQRDEFLILELGSWLEK